LRNELLKSDKDRAENIMIVDLLRNDLGRVCEFGTVQLRELCALQELPTLFHLVSTIDGRLRADTKPSEVIRSLFPCGSITGTPKLRTMEIIDDLEPIARGLSMGAIGVYMPRGFGIPPMLDLSVGIRTMVIRESRATFNVGGGIVIDSDPETEWEESLFKARALLSALGIDDTNKDLA
jgi:para-aminobenzoate synthetase component 1